VIVVVDRLHPSVSGFNWESAGDTLRCEQLVPIFFTVRQAVLQVEGAVGKDLVAVGARKALRVEVRGHRLQAVPNNLFPALATVGRQVTAIAVFAIKLTFFLDKSDLLEGPLALVHGAEETSRTPGLPHRGDERTSKY